MLHTIRKMQIKTTRHTSHPLWWLYSKTDNNACGEIGTIINCWCTHFAKVWQFLKILNTELPYNPVIPLLDIYQRKLKTWSHKNMYMNVHSSIIHNSWNLETTQMSINSLMDKQNVALILATRWMNHKSIMLSKKPITKDHILHDSIYMKCPDKAKSQK